MKKLAKVLCLVLACVMLVSVLSACGAKSYPNKNLTIVCPYGAGGTTDLCIRGAVEAIPDGTLPKGVNIVTTNVTGGSGLVGTAEFQKAASDGYTLGIVNCDLVLNLAKGETEIRYDSFTPVAALMKQANLILINPNNGKFDSLESLAEYAKANPGALNAACSGKGAIPYFSEATIEKALGLKFEYLVYDSDTAAATAVVAGEADLVICSAAAAIGQVQAGGLVVIGVTDNQRMASFPEAPAMGEVFEELKDVRILTWVYLAVKNDVPAEQIAYLQDAFAKAEATTKFADTLASFTLEVPQWNGADDAVSFWNDQYAFYTDLLAQLG